MLLKLNLHVSWIFLPSAPPPAPYITDVGYFDMVRFTVGWIEAPGSQMVDGFTFNITPNDLMCKMRDMTVTCPYTETNLGQTYIFTVAALNCGTQMGSYAPHRIHLRGMSLTVADYANTCTIIIRILRVIQFNVRNSTPRIYHKSNFM